VVVSAAETGSEVNVMRDALRIAGIVFLAVFALVVALPLIGAAVGLVTGVLGMLVGLAIMLIKLAVVLAVGYLLLVGVRALVR
jgi:hypothetical protein